MKILLEQDLDILLRNAEPIRKIFNDLRSHFPPETHADIVPAAYIEGHQIRFEQAKLRLADWASKQNIQKEVDIKKAAVEETKNRIAFLEESRPSMVANVDRLRTRRAELAKELQSVTTELAAEEKKLLELPGVIEGLKKKMKTQAADALKLHRKAKPIASSPSEDQRVIDDIDAIRRRAINALNKLISP